MATNNQDGPADRLAAGRQLPSGARWLGYSFVLALFVAIAAADVRWGDGRSLSLFYMVPVAFAAGISGSMAGGCIAALAGVARMLAGIATAQPAAMAGWNAGMTIGLLVTVSFLIDAIVRRRDVRHVATIVAPGLVAGVAGGVLLTALGSGFSGSLMALVAPLRPSRPASPPADQPDVLRTDQEPPLTRLARTCERVLNQSRPLLVGSRDLSKGSCVDLVRSGQLTDRVPQSKGDLDGGPGTTLAVLLSFDRQGVHSALEDLHWHQTRLAAYLDNQIALNEVPSATARDFHTVAAALADRLAAAAEPPSDLGAAPAADESTWPGYCLRRLAAAAEEGDVERMRRWSRELAAAALWLADLHRWRIFLCENFRDALRFQALAREPFEAGTLDEAPYRYLAGPSNLPGGMLTLHGVENFLELERQAEMIFWVAPDQLAELEGDRHLTAESIHVPPAFRRAYLALAEPLREDNRRSLAAAARLPYEHSFLVNMLYRATAADTLPDVVEVLRRFDQLSPASTPEQLMGVLVYRGHSFSGIEWADRFQPILIEKAGALTGATDADAFADACRMGHELFEKRTAYGVTLSLRDAISRGVMDCVRTTDFVLDLFRNSDRSGIGHVRWAAGTAGHTVPALWGAGTRVTLIDPLDPRTAEAWPDAYFHGARWPEALRENPPAYTAELFVRGLDSYVWAQGYVIRGDRAGTLVKASIPYLRPFLHAGTETAFAGPATR